MLAYAVHGTIKPPLGAQINVAHPFANGLLFAVLFNDMPPGTILPITSGLFTSSCNFMPGTALGTIPVANQPVSPIAAYDFNANNGMWVANSEGAALYMPGADTDLRIFYTNASPFSPAALWLPLKNVTVCVIRRRLDTTNRNSALFGVSSTDAKRCSGHAPSSDGITYWDFGGSSSPNRLTVTYAITTAVERWIFHAGDAGSAIWCNGVKLASQSTAISRSSDATSWFHIGQGSVATVVDPQEFNYFAIYNVQWTDALCQWWSAEPYEHLYPPRTRTLQFMATPSTTQVTGALSSAGVGAFAAAGGVRSAHEHQSGSGAKKHRPGKTRR